VTNRFPPGWDEQRIQRILAYYENQTEDEAVAEDEAAYEPGDETLIAVPLELLPAVREMIGLYQAEKQLRRKTV
jgi:hypothetical protein